MLSLELSTLAPSARPCLPNEKFILKYTSLKDSRSHLLHETLTLDLNI
jgi:hypothetical protein